MILPLILDADGLDGLTIERPPVRLRSLLHEALDSRREVLVPAVVCAAACRGAARTRAVESALARHRPRAAQHPPVRVVNTDFGLARRVGAVLHGANAASADLADAHVVAIAAEYGGGLVVTGDPDDILRLAQATPQARIVVRPAR